MCMREYDPNNMLCNQADLVDLLQHAGTLPRSCHSHHCLGFHPFPSFPLRDGILNYADCSINIGLIGYQLAQLTVLWGRTESVTCYKLHNPFRVCTVSPVSTRPLLHPMHQTGRQLDICWPEPLDRTAAHRIVEFFQRPDPEKNQNLRTLTRGSLAVQCTSPPSWGAACFQSLSR